MRAVRRFLRRFVTVWRWLPVVCSDQQWDHAYLLEIVAHKLRLMLDFWESDAPHCIDAAERAAEIRRALEIAERLVDSNYLDGPEFDEHTERWGHSEWVWRDLTAEEARAMGRDGADEWHEFVGFRYPLAHGDAENERAQEEWRALVKQAEDREARDWFELWQTISMKGRGWWD